MKTKARADDIYVRLAKKIPIVADLEASPKIFRHLLTPEQAELVDAFPGVAEELATKVGRDLDSVKKDLDYMYRVGIGTPSARTGKWNLPRSYMLFVDKLCTHHRNAPVPYFDILYELHDEWEDKRMKLTPEKRNVLSSGGEAGSRLIPAYTAVKDKPELQPWESMKDILQMADKIALVDCPCRVRNRGHGNCQMPNTFEVCMLLNRDAEYAVDSGSASRFIPVEEAMKHVERMEKMGMLHNATGTRGVSSLLCNCCIDHCISMGRYYRYGKDRALRHPSRWRAVVDTDLCVGCGVCQERCWYDAVSRKRDTTGELKAVIDAELCMGCGSCVVGCPHGALDMECVRPEEWVPGGLGTRPGESRDYPQYANL